MTNINNINNTITTNNANAIATTIAYDYNYNTPAINEQINPMEQDYNNR